MSTVVNVFLVVRLSTSQEFKLSQKPMKSAMGLSVRAQAVKVGCWLPFLASGVVTSM